MLFHHRLHGHLPAQRPDNFDGEWPPASAVICAQGSAVISAYQEAWRGILAVDYRPVFQTGSAALAALANNPDTGLAVRNLARVVTQISEEVAGLRHDLLGRIFHRVLDTARYDGSYYTSTAAAVLLASLAIREQDADWGDPNAVAALRICDPACGTGTLLMAAAERIRDLRNAAGRGDPANDEANPPMDTDGRREDRGRGGEGVTGAMIRARIRVDGRLAAVCRRFGGRLAAYSGCGEPMAG